MNLENLKNKSELNILEAAVYTGKSVYTIRRYILLNNVPARQGDKNEYLIDRVSLENYIIERENKKKKNQK